jgi:hypothetical protein
MKKYKLLKDLPCAEAGEIFQQGYDENDKDNVYLFQGAIGAKYIEIWLDYIDDFDEWFEEVEEPEQYFSINIFKAIVEEIKNIHYSKWAIENMKSIGILFETQEEAEEYLEYLKAKAVIKQDTKGFKPNWNDTKQIKYSCSYDEDRFTGYGCVKPVIDETSTKMGALIYFKSKEGIEESLKKHPEEWRKYLFYEQ